MAGRGRPGSAPQTAKREQYAALIARGVNNAKACRIVGINRRTGKRWRHGRTITTSRGGKLHYAPVVGARKPIRNSSALAADAKPMATTPPSSVEPSRRIEVLVMFLSLEP